MTELTTEEILGSADGFVAMMLDEDTPRREPEVREWPPRTEDVREWPQARGRATFADVVGQEEILRLLRLEVESARAEGRRVSRTCSSWAHPAAGRPCSLLPRRTRLGASSIRRPGRNSQRRRPR